jgi:hypothetical protein
MLSFETLKTVTLKLLEYCQSNNWAGYDPYDALNSKIYNALPFLDFRLFRLGFTQALKRSPINFRPLLLVPKTENSKAIALFLMAFLKLKKLGLLKDESLIELMIQKLITLRSPRDLITRNSELATRRLKSVTCNLNNHYWCWGYNFDWQTRSLLVPEYTPNIICTTFAGNALLDAYQLYGNPRFLEFAISAGHFIINFLAGTVNGDEICFSYTPLAVEQVHNANLLGAAFVSRLYKVSREKVFIDESLSAVRYSVRRQREDGSWPYSEDVKARWVDNFHTGYNLVSLNKFCLYAQREEFLTSLKKGLDFYVKNFFTKDGIAKYYNDGMYPIDIHSIAQSIITLVELKSYLERGAEPALGIFEWVDRNMKSREGYFYYQKTIWFKNKVSYMRWSQAWMLYALATFAENVFSGQM